MYVKMYISRKFKEAEWKTDIKKQRKGVREKGIYVCYNRNFLIYILRAMFPLPC